MRVDAGYKAVASSLDYIDPSDLIVIEMKAKALTLAECFEFLCIAEDELSAIELRHAKMAWKRGRAEGISTAADKLFSAMSMRGGGAVAMDYLKALSGTFTAEAVQSSSGGFSFNVTLPDEETDV